MFKTTLPIVLAIAMVGLAVYVQGMWTDRWGEKHSGALLEFTERLDNVPMKVGKWVGVDTELDEEQRKATHCPGHLSRTYKHSDTGKEVSVYVVCGTGRNVTIHTPDWCYQAAGFRMESNPHSYDIDCGDSLAVPEFQTTAFNKEDAMTPQRLRIFWSFSHSGEWNSPRGHLARVMFTMNSAVYKVYFIAPIEGTDASPEKSPAIDLAKELMPALNKAFFTEAATPTEATPAADAQASR